jgi:Fe-S cluster biogenesis protein NfuA
MTDSTSPASALPPSALLSSDLLSALETVIAPLVEADSGELYWLPAETGPVRLHLAGRFSGCAGNSLVTSHIIRPALEKALGSRKLEVSSGRIIPPQATRVRPRAPA